MECKKCNKHLSADAHFCIVCGTPVDVLGEIGYCPNCGNEISAEYRFCAHCGVVLSKNKYDDFIQEQIDDLEKIITNSSNDQQLFFRLAMLYKRLGNQEKARNILYQLVEQKPIGETGFHTYYYLGRMLSEELDNPNSLRESIVFLQSAIELCPEAEKIDHINSAIERISLRLAKSAG